MGASNAIAAYVLYASKVASTPLSVLVYMALISKDRDREPWWSQGHDVLATNALGREPLVETGDEKLDKLAQEAMEQAVQRAIKPLKAVGAITVSRHSSGHPGKAVHVRYRLWLVKPAPTEKRSPRRRSGETERGVLDAVDVSSVSAPDENRRVLSPVNQTADASAPDENRKAQTTRTRRKASSHPTVSVPAPDENRRAKDYEEYEERIEKQEYPLFSSDSVPVRAREAVDANVEIGTDTEPVYPTRCEYEDCPVPQKPVPAGSRYHTGCGLAVRRAARAKDGGEAA